MKTAQQSAEKFGRRGSEASSDYLEGAKSTQKDQAAAAIAASEIMKSALMEALNRGAHIKGLQKSGKAGWLKGVTEKGADRFGTGILSSVGKYAQNSAVYDGARNAASALPRGKRGSEANFSRSKAVGQALNAVRIGSSK